MRKLLSFAILGFACLVCARSRGAVLISDNFDYPDGAFTEVSGGVWVHHSGAVTGEVQVVSGRVLLSQTNTEDVSIQIPGQPYSPASNTFLYASFKFQVTLLPGAPAYFAHFKGPGSSGFAGRLFVTTNGATPGFFRIGTANAAGTPVLLGADLALRTDYRLVERYSVAQAASTLWLNPVSESDTSLTAADNAGSTNAVTGFAFRESDNMGTILIDEFMAGLNFAEVLTNSPSVAAPTMTLQPQSQSVYEGASVTFTSQAIGNPPPQYQWQKDGTELPGQTDAALKLLNVSTNDSGSYRLIVSNAAGFTNSVSAILTVQAGRAPLPALSVVTYNAHGNGATNFSTDMAQVQALGRQLAYLNADIITLNEVPNDYVWQLTNFVAAYLPSYYVATNSATDGFIRSAVLSRWPILFSKSFLHSADLDGFGYTNANFTRDLFEAEIAVPDFPQPLDVFVTHLKATLSTPQLDANKRAAEASAISNFLVTAYLPTNHYHPYLLTGDLNEDVFRPETNRYTSGLPVQELVAPSTGLMLTTPVNPVSGSEVTESIQGSLNVRFDYVLPCGILSANIVSSQVFRTDLLVNPPFPLLPNDDRTASDHLPVQMIFANPYNKPFRLTLVEQADKVLTLGWEANAGQSYRIEGSTDLSTWTILADNVAATGPTSTMAISMDFPSNFFRVRRLP